jgi:aldehyde:ferredoxin oxidoreductase
MGKADLLIELQDVNAALDSLVACKFAALALSLDDYAQFLSMAVGVPIDSRELRQVGERIWNMEKLFNLRAGLSRADDTLPRRLLEEPAVDGPAKGRTVDLEPMLDEYYLARGWDSDGGPAPEKLDELGLGPLLVAI